MVLRLKVGQSQPFTSYYALLLLMRSNLVSRFHLDLTRFWITDASCSLLF